MDFTYKAYISLIDCLKKNNYHFCKFDNYLEYDKSVVMRHDIDISIEQAQMMCSIEANEGISSTYFLLVNTDMYNPLSKKSVDTLRNMKKMGASIGLHFDETKYNVDFDHEINKYIAIEKSILENIIEEKINYVSWHRPSKEILKNGFEPDLMQCVYNSPFCNDLYYVSDSRRHWKQEPIEVIERGIRRIQILTHPIWYKERKDSGIDIALKEIIKDGAIEKYNALRDNIRDFDSEVTEEYIRNKYGNI